MGNGWQKLLYHLAAFMPILVIGALVMGLQTGTYTALAISIVLACVVCSAFCKGFKVLKTRLPVSKVRVTGFESKDTWLIGYVVSYLFPLASLTFQELNLSLCVLLSFFVMLVLQFSVQAIPNPLLTLQGYHFYSISTEQGAGFLLITKRKLVNKNAVHTAKQMFENLLIDTEE